MGFSILLKFFHLSIFVFIIFRLYFGKCLLFLVFQSLLFRFSKESCQQKADYYSRCVRFPLVSFNLAACSKVFENFSVVDF